MMDLQQTMKQAATHYQAGALAEAARAYGQVLKYSPGHADATHMLGLIAAARNEMDDALVKLRQSILLAPQNLVFKRNFAVVLTKSPRPADRAQAVVEARKLVEAVPGDATLVQVYAQAAAAAEQFAESARAWKWVTEKASPNDAQIWFNLAVNLQHAQQYDEAIQAYHAALKLVPDHADALHNLCNLNAKGSRQVDSIEVMRRALEARPADVNLQGLYACILIESGRITEGEALLESIWPALEKGYEWLHNRARVLNHSGRSAEAATYLERTLEINPDDVDRLSALMLILQYPHPDDPAKQLTLHQRVQTQFDRLFQRLPPVVPVDVANRRLRIGFVSGDFFTHSVGFFITPLLQALHRHRVEVHCFNNVAFSDALTQRIRASAEGWHDIHGQNDEAAAALIRKLGIDVLIDLSGHTNSNRLSLFHRCPAPLQLTYLGYPNTTGLQAFDGRVTDVVADPPGQTDTYHAEPLLRMPAVFAIFMPDEKAGEVAPAPCQANGHVTFACVSGRMKLNDVTLRRWCLGLRELGTAARLRFIGRGWNDAGVQDRLRATAALEGVDPVCFEFTEQLQPQDYFQAHAAWDVVLDTFPFNGHTTTVQNLWMGVPVLTLAGQSHRSRMGASVLSAVGLHDWIAYDDAAFVQKMVEIGKDPVRIAGVRASLRERMRQSPLMAYDRFATDFENLIFNAWDKKYPDHPANRYTS
jgi:protein O-GlcNAc transferase